jgi:hypothetical protein
MHITLSLEVKIEPPTLASWLLSSEFSLLDLDLKNQHRICHRLMTLEIKDDSLDDGVTSSRH